MGRPGAGPDGTGHCPLGGCEAIRRTRRPLTPAAADAVQEHDRGARSTAMLAEPSWAAGRFGHAAVIMPRGRGEERLHRGRASVPHRRAAAGTARARRLDSPQRPASTGRRSREAIGPPRRTLFTAGALAFDAAEAPRMTNRTRWPRLKRLPIGQNSTW